MITENNVTRLAGREDSAAKMWIKANEESLLKQSRSFAIPILNLDERFMIPVLVQYNLNKAIDTIEDSTALEPSEKKDLIKTFCEYLHRDAFSFEVQERMLQVTPQEESFVFKNYQSTINLFNTLSVEEKALGKKWTAEMAEGMCAFITRPINTLKDLNAYCYYVAGTVGLYLTNLLKLNGSNVSENTFEKLNRNAISFGLFLQKLNIIRDFVDDTANKKRAFWPQMYFEREKDRLKILNRMTFETLKNDVPRAINYFIHIPPGNDSYDYFIRFILSSGIEYSKLLRNNDSVFSDTKVKLPKRFIQDLYANVSSLTREEFRLYCEKFHDNEIAHYL
jgi:farnesyl-diphosphate farnesyltransferase